jgi:hypothetical protein
MFRPKMNPSMKPPPDFTFAGFDLGTSEMAFERILDMREGGWVLKSATSAIMEDGKLRLIVGLSPFRSAAAATPASSPEIIETPAATKNANIIGLSVGSKRPSDNKIETPAAKKAKRTKLTEPTVLSQSSCVTVSTSAFSQGTSDGQASLTPTVKTSSSNSQLTASQQSCSTEVASAPPKSPAPPPLPAFVSNNDYRGTAQWVNSTRCITHPENGQCDRQLNHQSSCQNAKKLILGHAAATAVCFKCMGEWKYCTTNSTSCPCIVFQEMLEMLEKKKIPKNDFCRRCFQYFDNAGLCGKHPRENTECPGDVNRILWVWACRTNEGCAAFSFALQQRNQDPPPQVPFLTNTNKDDVLKKAQLFVAWISASQQNNKMFWQAVREAWNTRN